MFYLLEKKKKNMQIYIIDTEARAKLIRQHFYHCNITGNSVARSLLYIVVSHDSHVSVLMTTIEQK